MHFHPSWTVIFVFIAFVSERIVGGDSNPNKQEEESPDLKTYRIKARVGRHFKTFTVAETELDANRSVVIGDERIFIPKRIPRPSRLEKWHLIQAHFSSQSREVPSKIRAKFEKYLRESPVSGGTRKHRRSLRQYSNQRQQYNNDDVRPWKRAGFVPQHQQQQQQRDRQERQREQKEQPFVPNINWAPLITKNTNICPAKFDAATRGFNRKLYLFSRDYVYLNWYDLDGLHQRATYLITEVFPGGPRHVTAALTNMRSGTTILFYYRTAYRFRWDRKHKRFFLAQKSPEHLPDNVDFVPKWAIQWRHHILLSEGSRFVTYDPLLNNISFSGKLSDYVPNVPVNTIGVTHDGNLTLLLMTTENQLKVYDMVKFKVVQEYPVSVKDFVACLPELPPEKEPKKTLKKNRTSVAIGRTKTAAKKS